MTARPTIHRSRPGKRPRWLWGLVVFLLSAALYHPLTLHFEPLVFDPEYQNVIFSADTFTTVGSISYLTFREHIRQHPLFSLITHTLMRAVRMVSPLPVNRAILATLTLVAASNCLLVFLLLRRRGTPEWLSVWLAGVYALLFSNLALFSIPETYALSTLGVGLFLWYTSGLHRPIATASSVVLGLLAGFCGLLNPPLLSLNVVTWTLLAGQAPRRRALALGAIAFGVSVATFVAVNVAIFGGEFYLNYVGDHQRYTSFGHFLRLADVSSVFLGFYLFAVVSPVGQLTHDLGLRHVTGYLDSWDGVSLAAITMAFLGLVVFRLARRPTPLCGAAVAWLAVLTAFYIYFNPPGVMLYTVQALPALMMIVAPSLTAPDGRLDIRHLVLAGFTGLLAFHNLGVVLAAVDYAGRS